MLRGSSACPVLGAPPSWGLPCPAGFPIRQQKFYPLPWPMEWPLQTPRNVTCGGGGQGAPHELGAGGAFAEEPGDDRVRG